MAYETINVSFIGRNYQFPKDIFTYIDEFNEFDRYRYDLTSFLLNFCPDYQHLPDDVEFSVYNEFREYGNRCVKKLFRYNIFDVTVDELVGSIPQKYTFKECIDSAENDGVKLFFTSLKEALIEMCNALREQIDTFQKDAMSAELRRASKITGSGIGVISSDPIELGIWMALEDRFIKKQEDAANSEFQNEISKIKENGENRQVSRLLQYEKNIWIPSLEKAADLFVLRLFDKYIDILSSRGCFNNAALNYLNLKKSKSILQNYEYATSKSDVLDAAFRICPFNSELYTLAMEIADADEIVKCAKLFGADGAIKEKVIKTCDDLASDLSIGRDELLERGTRLWKYLSLLKYRTDFEGEYYILMKRAQALYKRIQDIGDYFSTAENHDLKDLLEEIYSVPIYELKITEAELKNDIARYLISSLLSQENIKNYEKILSETVKKMLPPLMNYYSALHKAKTDYEEKKEICDNELQSLNSEIDMIKKQYTGTSTFALLKKRELKNRLEDLMQYRREMLGQFKKAKQQYKSLID